MFETRDLIFWIFKKHVLWRAQGGLGVQPPCISKSKVSEPYRCCFLQYRCLEKNLITPGQIFENVIE